MRASERPYLPISGNLGQTVLVTSVRVAWGLRGAVLLFLLAAVAYVAASFILEAFK